MTTHLPRPDLIVYLYLEVSQLQKNIHQRGRDYERLIRDDYLEKIQAGYLNHFRSLSDFRILVIDTNQVDLTKNQKDYRQLKEVIKSEFDVGIHRLTI
jgi:deoxyadenosine/deoxycytidine kinase